MHANQTRPAPVRPWNKGKCIGQKPHVKLKEILAIRSWLQLEKRTRYPALFNPAIDGRSSNSLKGGRGK